MSAWKPGALTPLPRIGPAHVVDHHLGREAAEEACRCRDGPRCRAGTARASRNPSTRSASLRATSNARPVLAVRLTRKPRTPAAARSASSRSVMSSPISAMPRSVFGMRLDGIDDEAVVVAVEPGLHHDAALEAGGAEHGEIVFEIHRRRRVEAVRGPGIFVARPEHVAVAVGGFRRERELRLPHVEMRAGAHRRIGGVVHSCFLPKAQARVRSSEIESRRLLRSPLPSGRGRRTKCGG